MAKARARTATRKVKDKFKMKQWYALQAPAMFNKAVISETLADDPNKVLGRISSTTMQDLTGDFKLMHIKLDFQVTEVVGSNASTILVGHSLTSDYVRRLIRRNHSKISHVVDVTTKDGAGIRLKPFCVTDRRTQGTQKTTIRNLIQNTLSEEAASKSMAAFLLEVFDGKMSAKLYRVCKPIYPLRKVEINKSEVFAQPTIQLEEPAPLPAAAPLDGAAPSSPEEGGPEQRSEEEGAEEAPAAAKA